MAHIDVSDAKYYDNRELSWLKFERRVLNEALVKELPILERIKFVGITSSNLDEFFMVRVASLKDMEHAGYTKPDIAGMTPTEQLIAINEKTRELVKQNKNIMALCRGNNDGTEVLTSAEQRFFDEINLWDLHEMLKEVF